MRLSHCPVSEMQLGIPESHCLRAELVMGWWYQGHCSVAGKHIVISTVKTEYIEP